MTPLQKFCIENIYCAPSQDRQYFFSLVRVNKGNIPLRRLVNVYNVTKNLPDNTNEYHVFILGNLFPEFLNLLSQYRHWLRDTWINFLDESVTRDLWLKIYDDKGILYPSSLCYYSFINENSLIIAIKVNKKFDTSSMKYLRAYSNSYFTTSEFLNKPVKIGIDIVNSIPENNVDKVNLQNYITTMETNGGKCLIFVNGYYTEQLTLNIPNYSFVEIIYDQSIVDIKESRIDTLRTFDSILDNRMKYLMFNNKNAEYIHYFDDNDFFIVTTNQANNEGLYFYRHKEYAIRNVTDKDYSLDATYVNNQATYLSILKDGYLGDKKLVCIFRKPGLIRNLKYSNLKLHELYKLPFNKQLDTLLGTGPTHPMFRVENLENSEYFKLASSNIHTISNEKCMDVLGYNATTFYFGKNVFKFTTNNEVEVPILYREYATAFEYDVNGKLIGYHDTTGPIYIRNNPNTRYVEFIYGRVYENFGKLYEYNETFTLEHNEYRILSALFSGINPITNWIDITNDTNKVIKNGNTITLNETTGNKVRVIYFNRIRVYELDVELNDSYLYFPLTIREERNGSLDNYPLDVPFLNIEIFLNGYKLTYGLDYFLDLPYISICNKKYLNYTQQYQKVHIRVYGYNKDEDKINMLESRGFVNSGVLLRNNVYDVRDDRVFSIFIDGKLYERENVLYAEEDNTVRLVHPLNGLAYTIKEPFISTKIASSLDTLNYFNSSVNTNKELSNFFNIVLPEPAIDTTNVISDHHYLYSPLLSRIIFHLLNDTIPLSYYQNFTDTDIVNLIDNNPEYKQLLQLDPVKNIEANNIVEIHPHLGNTTITVNIFQYRFIQRIVELVLSNRINLSGYLTIS